MGDIKIFNLNDLTKKFNIVNFFETGTFKGEAIDFALKHNFQKIVSIEIEENLFLQAKDKFKNEIRVQILHGDSSVEIENILNHVKGNTIFWLDAHFPGADNKQCTYDKESNTDTRVPLKKELEKIRTHCDTYDNVIIIDDLWLYEEGPFEWGTFDSHMLKYHNGEKRKDICGQDSKFIFELFKNSHNIETINNHQGYLLLTPKQK